VLECWVFPRVGDCLLYTNSQGKLNYYVGGEVITLAHLDRRMYMLGYLSKEGRVYLMDKSCHVASYQIPLSILEYQTAVVRRCVVAVTPGLKPPLYLSCYRDFETANAILPSIPKDQHNTIAKFLESQGFKEEALQVADDPDIKFDLALQLNKLDVWMDG
jgi:coatomer subunit beta'